MHQRLMHCMAFRECGFGFGVGSQVASTINIPELARTCGRHLKARALGFEASIQRPADISVSCLDDRLGAGFDAELAEHCGDLIADRLLALS